MEFFIKISKNGDMALETLDGSVQYVAKYNGNDFSGSIFDDLALAELVSIKNVDSFFSVSAFDSSLGTFQKQSNRFLYGTENDSYKIEQKDSSFLLFADGNEVGTVSREGAGFKLSVISSLTPLIGFAMVIVIIAAKSLENAKKTSEIDSAEKAPKSDAMAEETAVSKDEETNEKVTLRKIIKDKYELFLTLLKRFKKTDIGKKLLSGPKIALVLVLIGIIGLLTSSIVTSIQNARLSTLKESKAVVLSKQKAKFVYNNATYTFQIPENFEGNTLNVYYTEKTETDKNGNKTTSLDKFYSTYPRTVDLSPLKVISIAISVISFCVYILSAFGILTKENFLVVLDALRLRKIVELFGNDKLPDQEE